MKTILLSLLFLGFFGGSVANSQEVVAAVAKDRKFYLDYVMGPYLFIDHIPYDAVFMNGCRLGFNIKSHFDFSIEYVVGQQQDDQNTLGMTHNVNGQFAYHPIPQSELFDPYLFVGGGFFEFKAFSSDVYGISYHAGGGTTVKFSQRISGLFEARYLNLGLMNLGGEHELAVLWGARVSF
jgi:hypothetical protein